MAPDNDNGWSKWEQKVLDDLKRHEAWLANISAVQSKILVAVAGLKAKSTTWGVIGGSIPVLVTILVGLLIWLIRG